MVVNPKHRPPLFPGNIPCAHFCSRLSRPQSQSAAGSIMSMKNSNDTIRNRTRDFPTCSTVLQPTAPLRRTTKECHLILDRKKYVFCLFKASRPIPWQNPPSYSMATGGSFPEAKRSLLEGDRLHSSGVITANFTPPVSSLHAEGKLHYFLTLISADWII